MTAEQFGFVRELDGQRVAVLLNASDRPVEVAVALKAGRWRDTLNGGEWNATSDAMTVEIPASWGRVLVAD